MALTVPLRQQGVLVPWVFYVDTVGRNRVAVEQYIRNQLEEDRVGEQLEMKELFDPFTGEPAKKDK